MKYFELLPSKTFISSMKLWSELRGGKKYDVIVLCFLSGGSQISIFSLTDSV